MTTKIMKKKTSIYHKNKVSEQADVKANINVSTASEGKYQSIPTIQIDVSPLNYRKFFSEEDLQSFASELLLHGIISPVTVRPMPTSRFELVAGERRLRAAKIGGITHIPAVIKNLTDEEVIEIQLSENLQREDPHPMHEAQGIGQMQKGGKTIDDISLTLGKSKQFIYTRIKLLGLIDEIQEMFLANVITIQQALEIASVTSDSQTELFEACCKGWQKDKSFALHNLSYYLNRFKYDLKQAPFNTKDKKLVPDVGACTACPSNTATLKSLFPEYSKQAVCTNKACYQNKCSAHFLIDFTAAFFEHQPAAILFNGEPNQLVEELLSRIQGVTDLPKYDRYAVTTIHPPILPSKEDFTNGWDDNEPDFDEESYDDAIEDYNSDLSSYNSLFECGKYQKAIYINGDGFEVVLFSLEKPNRKDNESKVTAKEVQAAIKAGNATVELLNAEIERITDREKRSVELDRQKVQTIVHQTFVTALAEVDSTCKLTAADSTGARLLIYQSLDYTARNQVNAALCLQNETSDRTSLLDRLTGLSEQQYVYLIRMAVAGKSESKYVRNDTAISLYSMAKDAGLNVSVIEQQQQEKAETRKEKLENRINELQKKIKKLSKD